MLMVRKEEVKKEV
jgi:hypothetical protein